MATIYKAELFLVDVNEEFHNLKDIVGYLESTKYSPLIHIAKSESKEFEWDDDVPINKTNCNTNGYNKFFDNLVEG